MTTFRVMRTDEFDAVRELSASAFGDDDVIRSLFTELRTSWAWEDELSFVAERDGALVGQVLFTHAFLDTARGVVDVLVLSPVGVRPDLQQQGIGTGLLEHALEVVRRRPEPLVFLEGSPRYYPRFGFRQASGLGFVAPSPRIPSVAFQVLVLPSHESWMTGNLVYPDAFWRVGAVGPGT